MAAAAATAILLPSIRLGSSSKSASSPSKETLALPSAAGFAHRNTFLRSSLPFSPLRSEPSENGRSSKFTAMATPDSSDPAETLQDFLRPIQDAWDKTEDKLAVGGLGFAALITLWASAGLINAIDKLPLISNFFEFVGILFTGWFVYRYLLFKPDREELLKTVESAWAKISGTDG